MFRVFLSHTSTDKDLVSAVHSKLAPHLSWYDAANIENGESIPEKINEGLRNATHYVLFWGYNASKSPWVIAELNAAFIRSLASKCKFMIFVLDDTQLPELLQPYKYDKFDKCDINATSSEIVNIIMSHAGIEPELSEFVNRTQEIGEIEESARLGYKLIILHGILGIGKSSLAERALRWLYTNRAMNRVVLDFSKIPGLAELCIELSRKAKCDFLNDNIDEEKQKVNIRYFLEKLSESKTLLILKDIKSWLNDDGTLGSDMRFITDIIVSSNIFDGITIATSSRYIEIPYEYYNTTRQIPIKGMSDLHISEIIGNNLPKNFEADKDKNLKFAQRLYGYPLGAKLSAYNIVNHGYEFYLSQPQKIKSLKISLAKNLISFAGLSDKCQDYLKIVSLSQSRLRNEEYIQAFPKMKDLIPKLADEAFFAGVLKFDDDGCYKIEQLVEDYYYDIAFNDNDKKDICEQLENFLLNEIRDSSSEKYLRLLPAAIHILSLNGKIQKALELRSEMTATIVSSMWDQYNHTEYEDSLHTAESLLSIDSENIEAQYVKALCLTRFDEYNDAEHILQQLLSSDKDNASRYYYALGRIQKKQGNYSNAIQMFEVALLQRPRYLSPHREMAECYIHMNELDKAQASINNAKQIDDSNIFVILLETLLLQKQGNAQKAIDILSEQSILDQNRSQILFRLGRAYDQVGEIVKAKKCYNDALEHNINMYDAKLCLLNHQIIEDPASAEKEIEKLKFILRGKRKAILTNIEARLFGYFKHNDSMALDLLDGVKYEFRDKQWYAVKKQLLENILNSNRERGREILACECNKKLVKLMDDFSRKFGETLVASDLLPDA